MYYAFNMYNINLTNNNYFKFSIIITFYKYLHTNCHILFIFR